MTGETQQSRRGVIGWMASNSVAANLLMLVFLLGGLAMIPRIRQEVFPEFDLDSVTVSVAYPGASPEDVEQGILLVVEEAIRGVDGVKRVQSTGNEGIGSVRAEVHLKDDTSEVLQDIKSAVDRIVTLPEEAERPVVSIARTKSRVLTIVIYGDHEPAVLKSLSDAARDALIQLPGISVVEPAGLPPVEVGIEIPQATLRGQGLTLWSVADSIRRSSLDLAGGGIKTDAGEVLLRLGDRREYGEQFKAVPVVAGPDGVVQTVGDLATVKDDFAETDASMYFNGLRAVGLDVYRVGDEKPLDISREARAFVEAYQAGLPPGVEAKVVSDRSDLYRERVKLLLRNAGLGLILVMVILGLFLEVRLAFWVMLGIPTSFLGSLLFLPQADVSINMISLFAFIISLGIVVDDAVVVGENVYHLRQQGKSFMEAAVTGARMMAIPVLLSILTNIAAVVPLLIVPGVHGKIWRNIPIIMILVFAISLVEALFILPAHLGHQRSMENRGIWKILDWPQEVFGRGMERFIDRIYAPFVKRTLRYRYLTVAVCLFAFIVTVGYIRGGRMRFTFFPKVEGDRISASAVLPYGAPLNASKAVSERLRTSADAVLDEYGGDSVAKGVQTTLGVAGTGFGPFAGVQQSGSHLVGVTVFLEPLDVRGFSGSEFTRKWRERVGVIPGLESLSFKFTIGPSSSMPIDVQLSHRDPEITEQAAIEVARALEAFDGVVEIDDGVARGKPQLEYTVTEEARSVGLTAQDVGRQVRAAYYGAEVTRQQRGRDEVKIMVRLPKEERISEQSVQDLILRTPAGGEIPFREAAHVVRGRAYDVIRRDEGRRILSVTADIEIAVTSAGEVLAGIKSNIMPDVMAKYPGLYFSFEGEQRERKESFTTLGMGFIAAVFVIFALLAIPFRSYLQGLIVLSAVPFGFVGAVIGHLIMGYNLSFVSMMGIVALSGVVVNDNLILVDTINRLRRSGVPLLQAAAEGPMRRFRPVVLTSLTTFCGLAPMIFEKSVQARFMIPMALSLGFGILYTTLIALVVVPSLYLIVERMKLRVYAALHREESLVSL
jgi:multidrug efflux pump subunit AcrB